MSGPLSFRKAAAALGMGDTEAAAKRLWRMVTEAEHAHGIEIASRDTKRPRVAVQVVLKYLPHLKPAATLAQGAELQSRFRTYIEEIDDRLRGIARTEADCAIQDTVEPQLNELRERDTQTLEMLTELARRVAVSLRPSQDK